MAYKDPQKRKEHRAVFYQTHKETYRRYKREYLERRRKLKKEDPKKYECIRKHERELQNANRRSNPRLRIYRNLAVHVALSLKNRKRDGTSWESLVGYSCEDLMIHLESQFTPEMNWDNYGSYWWVDHIIPVSFFEFKKIEDIGFKQCWAITNLQPLEKMANIQKGNKILLPCGKNLTHKKKYSII